MILMLGILLIRYRVSQSVFGQGTECEAMKILKSTDMQKAFIYESDKDIPIVSVETPQFCRKHFY